MYEVVKVVNGYSIWRMVGTHAHFTVRLDNHRYMTFRTIKAAADYCKGL